MHVLISCEHGGNIIPGKYSYQFISNKKVLKSHLGYDPGAFELSKAIHNSFNSDFIFSQKSRLLIDLNRSLHHKNLFSKYSKQLSIEEKQFIIKKYYTTYRQKAVSLVLSNLTRGNKVLHLSIHTFTHVLNNKKRNADIGLLYDPKKIREKDFCINLKKNLFSIDSRYKIRFNYPYLGIADGLTKYLRTTINNKNYLGIEIEVNQKKYFDKKKVWTKLKKDIINALKSTISSL